MERIRKASQQVVSATRLHFPLGTSEVPAVSVQHLRDYAVATSRLGVPAVIAVNCLPEAIESIILEAAPDLRLRVLHVPEWGAFVPALNALLGEAQRKGAKFILYHSLEVCCTPDVLELLWDHMISDVLVVGVALDGHIFREGQQPLNGRTTPWNTLALWQTRKLALTGFLSIADGMPRQMSQGSEGDDVARSFQRQISYEPPVTAGGSTMGSSDWWDGNNLFRQESGNLGIPAGVEEVTAIALLQHVLGPSSSRAVLLDLPDRLTNEVSWKANWGGDEKRREWHERKMASKVSRPAAQMNRLFSRRGKLMRTLSNLSMTIPLLKGSSPVVSTTDEEKEPELFFGQVFHFGESIRPPPEVERICLACILLFAANFTSCLSAAFGVLNEGNTSWRSCVYMGFLIGGVYVPMPLSLYCTRKLVSYADHIAGLGFFLCSLLVSHSIIAMYEVALRTEIDEPSWLLILRMIQGLGSGVLFQTRFILVSTSTVDHHFDLYMRSALASDLGLVIGCLLPYVCSLCVTGFTAPTTLISPVHQPSYALAFASLVVFVWLLLTFPRRLYRLPSNVRFPDSLVNSMRSKAGDRKKMPTWLLLLSGTLRVFVQSAAAIALASAMRKAHMIGNFHQSIAVAVLLVINTPLKALCLTLPVPFNSRRLKTVAFFVAGAALVVEAAMAKIGLDDPWLKFRCRVTGVQLAALLFALTISAPTTVRDLNRKKHAERTIVLLEWLKGYFGRLLVPIFTLAVEHWLGYDVLLLCLCIATVLVVATAS